MQPNASGDDATVEYELDIQEQIFQLVSTSMSQDMRSAWDRASIPCRGRGHRMNTWRSFEHQCAARYWALVPQVPNVPPVLGFVLLGLEVCKPHSCFASCSLCRQRGRWRETERLEDEARKGCFLSASCSCRPHPNSPSSSWQRLMLLSFGPSLGAFNRHNQPYYAPRERR